MKPTVDSGKTPLSPRRRRLRWTIMFLICAGASGLALGIVHYFKNRIQQYRPDEQLSDITSSLTAALPPEAPRPRFADVTHSAGLGSFPTFVGQRTSQMPEDMGPGAAWGDFDNDGDDDLFLVSAGGPMNGSREQWAACELHENLGDGSFRKSSGFPELRILGMAAAWGDYDEDGFLDLFVSGYNTLLLFHNEAGTGRFVRDARFPERKGFCAGASWGDYDNDRHLDLYVCGYIQYVENDADFARASMQIGSIVPFTLNPASYPGGTNLLFHNRGDGTFIEVGAQLKVQNPEGRSLGALWHDFDDDGRLDLYVANDISDNVLYQNTGGKFTDLSHAACVADYRSAMGLAAGDYNRDGDDDLFVAHWVAQENALYDSVLADLAPLRKDASPSGTNPIHLRFMDIADMKGLGQKSLPYVGWGTEFVDVDADGWLDLLVANGNTLEFDGPIPRKLKPQESFLFWNQRGEMFHNLGPLSKPFAEEHVSRGLAVSDYDNDGDMDVLITDLGEGVRLLRNDMQTGNWIKVRLRSRLQNGKALGFGDGAKVIAHLGKVGLRRTVSSVSYLSQSSRTLHFGLGNAIAIDRLEVRWLGGRTNNFTNLQANATWEVTEDEAAPRRLEPKMPGPRPDLAARMPSTDERTRLVEFWEKQRAAMNAMKVEKDLSKATALFQQALKLDPKHEDSRYYLAHCLSAQGDINSALTELEVLQRINSHSHRAFQQWGCLRALSAVSDSELAAAEKALEQAHTLNPEETGALLLLGEISLLRGDKPKAQGRFSAACRSNPRAVAGFFLQGYLAWKGGNTFLAQEFLTQTRQALGPDWQPKGSTSEGEVQRKHHTERSPLARHWELWDGATDPARAYASLDAHLKGTKP